MASAMDKLENVLKDPGQYAVYYLASTEAGLLAEQGANVRRALLDSGADSETTRVDGPVPDLGEVIAAAGALSFLGTRRVVELRDISPSTMRDKDVEELATLFADVDSAVLVVTALYKDKKTATSKKAKLLFDAASKNGFALQLEKPTRRENVLYVQRLAEKAGAAFAPGAADALVDRAGEDRALLQNEVDKLAAASGYTTINTETVAAMAVHNIEADVFELSRLIVSGRRQPAHKKLQDLLALRHEPIAIAAALAGSFTDMYRAQLGAKSGHSPSQVFKDFGYYGSDWRLQKAKESAAAYTPRHLEECVLCLYRLDRELKSSALPDKSILLQAAVGRLLMLGGRR